MLTNNISINYPNYGNIVLKEGYAIHKNWYINSERQTKQWWAQNIKPHWNILDIGANVGMYSVLFSKLATEGSVFCFEPTPTIEILKRNLENINSTNCYIYKQAVGNKVGKSKDKIQMIWKKRVLDENFDFTTIDQFVLDKEIKIDAIKIDVDGYDPEVLYGARDILGRQEPVVIVELNPEALGYRGHTPGQAVEFMRNQKYPLVKIMDGENYLFRKA